MHTTIRVNILTLDLFTLLSIYYVLDLCYPRKINLLLLTAIHPFQFLLGSWFSFDSFMWEISIIHASARYKCFALSVSVTIYPYSPSLFFLLSSIYNNKIRHQGWRYHLNNLNSGSLKCRNFLALVGSIDTYTYSNWSILKSHIFNLQANINFSWPCLALNKIIIPLYKTFEVCRALTLVIGKQPRCSSQTCLNSFTCAFGIFTS